MDVQGLDMTHQFMHKLGISDLDMTHQIELPNNKKLNLRLNNQANPRVGSLSLMWTKMKGKTKASSLDNSI